MADWPLNLQERLSRHTHGLFAWITTVMDYLKNESINPLVALEHIMSEGASKDDVAVEKNLDQCFVSHCQGMHKVFYA